MSSTPSYLISGMPSGIECAKPKKLTLMSSHNSSAVNRGESFTEDTSVKLLPEKVVLELSLEWDDGDELSSWRRWFTCFLATSVAWVTVILCTFNSPTALASTSMSAEQARPHIVFSFTTTPRGIMQPMVDALVRQEGDGFEAVYVIAPKVYRDQVVPIPEWLLDGRTKLNQSEFRGIMFATGASLKCLFLVSGQPCALIANCPNYVLKVQQMTGMRPWPEYSDVAFFYRHGPAFELYSGAVLPTDATVDETWVGSDFTGVFASKLSDENGFSSSAAAEDDDD
ncbi:hypothetical protein PHYSODRAFT_305007 [Phytophthora sojae]|uniref:Uncharacterized protein n=1 Tax=Phytophthora sojae (strain P6497) TaxID=1094619 RepID=G5A3X9_PHYSP|nr:hypothetical protein PHYSODRAFT_305007 [Phytophthora sojae]EGZ09479.1 hypothetical protein PHYSODRAFT_305007 [Phytophthora sojae]|eukprot:XP_009534340.1 hypothetical protein PHYSODRAFT_305007 [Phytophthora sojae]